MLEVGTGDVFASYGAGAVGLSGVMAAAAAGASTIIATDVVESRLQRAREFMAILLIQATRPEPRELSGYF